MFTPTNPAANAIMSLGPEALWISEYETVPHDFWQTLNNVTASGDNNRTITRTTGDGAWTASGSSCEYITGDGWVDFTVNTTGYSKVAGLSADNPDDNYTGIDFALYPASDGNVYSSENGVFSASLGAYSAGDVLRVKRVGTTITYYKNGSLLRTSGVSSTGNLFFDSSIFNINVNFSNIVMFGATSSWSPLQGLANVIVVPGSYIIKSLLGTAWNAGCSSSFAINGDGYVAFTSNELGTAKACGLSVADTNVNYTSIDFCIVLQADNYFSVYESGVGPLFLSSGTYTAGQEFRVIASGSTIAYWYNGAVFYTSSTSRPANPLMADISIYSYAGTIKLLAWSGESPRLTLQRDLTGNGHDISQATFTRMPLLDAKHGVAPYLLFNATRGDCLRNAAAITVGTSPYTILAVYRWRKLTSGATLMFILSNGEYGTNGMSMLQVDSSGAKDQVRHVANFLNSTAAADTTLKSVIFKDSGGDGYWRKSGVDETPAALAAQVTPVGGINIGAVNSSGGSPADMDLYVLAIFKRDLTPAEMVIADNILEQYYGI